MSDTEARLLSAGTVVLLYDSNMHHVLEEFRNKIPDGKLLTLEHGALGEISTSNVDVVVSYTSDPALHSNVLLLEVMRLLMPYGLFVIYEPLQGRSFSASDDLSSRLLLAGFTNTRISSCNDMIQVSSLKPEWEVGVSQKVEIKKQVPMWSSATSELIDEDSLLNEGDKYVKPATTRDDCEVGAKGKKACKNCTCGRAEEEAGPQKVTLDMLDNGVKSSCGSCGLGDAFRCAGCPYRGLPAFSVGEKVTIPSSFLEDDI